MIVFLVFGFGLGISIGLAYAAGIFYGKQTSNEKDFAVPLMFFSGLLLAALLSAGSNFYSFEKGKQAGLTECSVRE